MFNLIKIIKMKQKFFLLGLLIISVLSAKAQMPSPRYGHSVCKIDSVYYIFGGALLDDNKKSTKAQPMDDLYRYNPENGFTKISTSLVSGSAPFPGMCGHTAVTQNGKMYIFNGSRSTATNAATYVYTPGDTTDGGWRQIIGLPSYNPKVYVFNGTRSEANDATMILAGGYDLTTHSASNECWKYDAQANAWTQLPNISYGGRYAGASAMIGSKFCLFGGLTDYGPTNDFLIFNTINNMWNWVMNPSGYMINGIFGGTFDAIGNSIFLCGGGMWSGKKNTMEETNFSTSLYEFQVDTLTNNVNIVKRGDGLPTSLYGAGWIDVTDNDTIMYMFGGIQNITNTGDTTLTNNFYRFNITDSLVQQLDTVQHIWGPVTSSINETEFDKNINLQVYPNPTIKEINLAIPNNETIESIKIFNQNGQLVKQITKPGKTSINVSDLNTGLYYIRTDSKTNRYLSKMIKD